MSRDHRRRSGDKLTTVGGNKKPIKKHTPPWQNRGTKSFNLSPQTKEEINDTLTPLDRGVLGLYVGIDTTKVTPRKIIPKKVLAKMEDNLDDFAFWDDIVEVERSRIKTLYLDYYVSSLLLRAYNNALVIIMDSPEIDILLKEIYQNERLKLVHQKILLDTLLQNAIDMNRTKSIREIEGPKKRTDPKVMSAISDIVHDLEAMQEEDFTEREQVSLAHSNIITMLDDSTRAEIIIVGE